MKIFKLILSSVLSLTLIFSSVNMLALADSPKPISNYQELCNISKDLKGSYYLTSDITAKGEFTPLGSISNQFKGVIDGRGYSIIGLNIGSVKSENGESTYSGFVAYNGGTIKNINFVGVNAQAGDSKYAYSGAVAAVNLGTIENCYVSGKVLNSGVTVANYTSGVVGQMLRGNIKNTTSYVNVYSEGGEQYTGGIAGYNEQGSISSAGVYGSVFANGINAKGDLYGGGICGYSRTNAILKDLYFDGGYIAEKFANIYLGGIVGTTSSKIENAVVSGTITPSQIFSHTYMGGILAQNRDADVKNTYFLEGFTNEKTTSNIGTELTKVGITNPEILNGLDFGSIWEIKEGKLALKGNPTAPEIDKQISQLTGIKITSKPKKTVYIMGYPSLDLTGLKVSAVYTDKEVELKQNDYTVSGYNYIKTGKQIITVLYKGFSDTFTITVKPSEEGVIMPEITEDSYFEGNSTGKEPLKDSDQSTSFKTESTSSNLIVDGNKTEDTLEQEVQNSEIAKNDTSAVGSVGGSDGPENVKISIKNPKTAWIIILAVIIIAVAGALIVFFTKRKANIPTDKDSASDE